MSAQHPLPRALPGGRRRRAGWALALGLPLLAGVAGVASGMAPATRAEAPPLEPLAAPAGQGLDVEQATPQQLPPITLSATGDVIMGATPNMLPTNGGLGFFDDVAPALASDLVMGNLEQALTDDTGIAKCGQNVTDCFQFRLPPSYAYRLADAGFDLMTLANNHTGDFGAPGYANTKASLAAAGIDHVGDRDQIAVTEVSGVKVAVIGFSPYPMHNQVTEIQRGQSLVRMADRLADVVVIQAQMGAEGADEVHTPYGNEIFYSEDRGDVRAFSRAMIDAGADLVVGHSPHVLRGMEFYQGRLIAYSLGNFAGGGNTLSNDGALGLGGILRVSLNPDGTFSTGQFVSTYMDGDGAPTLDYDQNSLALLRSLNASDFGDTGVAYDDYGNIAGPSATADYSASG